MKIGLQEFFSENGDDTFINSSMILFIHVAFDLSSHYILVMHSILCSCKDAGFWSVELDCD